MQPMTSFSISAACLVRILGLAVAILCAVGTAAVADSFEDGFAAYKQGDYATAHRIWLPLAEGGHASAQNYVGILYKKGLGVRTDPREAANWYRKAARQGHAWAQNNLGAMYRQGKGVERDYAEAMKWLRRSAGHDIPAAFHNLGGMYWKGQGVAKDPREAARWFRRAAEMGFASSQHSLGSMYYLGQGVARDYAKALEWFKRAGDQGHAKALGMVGKLYYEGKGVPKSESKALIWFNKAAAHGHQAIREALSRRGLLADNQFVTEGADSQRAGIGSTGNPSQSGQQAKSRKRIGGVSDQEIKAAFGALRNSAIPRTGPLIRGIQRHLAELGHLSGAVDGIYGPQTKAAIERFQKAAGLDVTGRPSPALLAQLEDRARNRASPPPAGTDSGDPGFTPPQNPYDVAVIVGNKSYAAAPDVDYAHADADAVRSYVRRVLGIREGNILDLRDAGLTELRTVFGSEADHRGDLFWTVKPGESEVVVFYSGHGVPDFDDSGARGYLLPVDARPETPSLGGYPLELLYRNLEKLPATRVTVLLDACFSGLSQAGTLVPRTSGTFGVAVAAPEPKTQLAVLTATAFDRPQYAHWLPEKGHGAFTYYALKGLYGAADTPDYGRRDGKVTLAEVKAYLDDEMRYQVRRSYRRDQTPSLLAAKGTDLTLSVFPDPDTRPQSPLP